MSQLVDKGELGLARQDRVDVHLLEGRPAVLDLLAGDHLEIAHLGGGARAPVGLTEPDDDVLAPLVTAPALVEHGKGLPDARRSAEVDAELAARHDRSAYDVTFSTHPAPG